jgi:type IV pilus assembly protein PilY1
MKIATQLLTSALAASGLVVMVAAQATSLSELPLKASVQAKPNVIFGLDDSGSMDSEVMLYNNDGAFWWNYSDGNGWGVDGSHPNPDLRTKTSTWFNAAGNANATWRKMVYLFPNGLSNTDGQRVYADAAYNHFAILPTTQFAFLRWSGVYRDASGVYRPAPSEPADSPVHNPLYYNPLVTYRPWAPANISTGAVAPAAASTSATRSHPILPTGGSPPAASLFDLGASSGVALNTTDHFVFTALPGMTIPRDSRINVCDASNAACAGWSGSGLGSDTAAAAGAVTRVAVAYFPATYWVKETCTLPPGGSEKVGQDDCATAPDGSLLKRYEIKSGNTFPSGRSYAAELQNFANWFQYYRKRKLMLAGAMGSTLESLTGMRLGNVRFNSRSTVTMYDADSTNPATGRQRVAGIFYETSGSGGTPTRETLAYIGDQFRRTTKTNGVYDVIQYACQRNNAFILTDGFAVPNAVTLQAYDTGKSAATWGSGAPYETIHSGSLADIALRMYTNHPRPPAAADGLAAGRLRATPTDPNTDLHVNTYGLTMGARGTLFFSESTSPPSGASDWPVPDVNRSPTSVDDLWHATINGRGKFYLANTPEETAQRVQAGLDAILDQNGAQSAIGVSSVNLGRGDDNAYLGRYNARGWTGDLTRNAVNNDTGEVTTTTTWTKSAATQLAERDWTTRLIFTDSGVLDTSNAGAVTAVGGAAQLNWMRGSRAGEGTTLRQRGSLIGAVINAEPVVEREDKVVYLASGEGLLHAFDSDTGAELWSYHPAETLAAAGASSARGWVFKTLLDATPTLRQQASGKLLVGGLGAAGRSYYALSVTSPRPASAAAAAGLFKWRFPTAADTTNQGLMGFTVGRPVVTRTAGDGEVVLVTSGYANGATPGDGQGRMWMLKASDGTVIRTFVTSASGVTAGANEAGLAHVSAFRELDGSVRYAYGGDLKGNLWRFDLSAGTTTRVATFKDGAGNVQPVTTAPEMVWMGAKRVIMVGTGRLLDLNDFGSSATQSFYALSDDLGGTALDDARAGLTARSYVSANETGTTDATPLTGSDFDWSSQRGWYFDLPAGEQANTTPTVAYGAVVFVTNKQGATDCSESSYLYLVDIGSGKKPAKSTFVRALVSSEASSSRVVTLRTVNGRIVATTHKSDNTVYQRQLDLAGGIPPSKNAWRELRR